MSEKGFVVVCGNCQVENGVDVRATVTQYGARVVASFRCRECRHEEFVDVETVHYREMLAVPKGRD